MRSLHSSYIFDTMNENSVLKVTSVKEGQCEIPLDNIELRTAINSIEKRYKDPFRYKAIEMLNNKDIVLLYSTDMHGNNLGQIPKPIIFWSKNVGGKITTFVNTTHFVQYSAKKNEYSFSVPVLYTLISSAAYANLMIKEPISFKSNTKFVSAMARCYSSAFTRLYDKVFGLSSNPSLLGAIMYASARYFIGSCMEIPTSDSAKNMAMTVFKGSPITNFLTDQVEEHFKGFYKLSFDEFINLITSYNQIFSGKKVKTVNNIMGDAMNWYGITYLLALDLPQYLLFNIISLINSALLNNDKRLEQLFLKDAMIVYNSLLTANLR